MIEELPLRRDVSKTLCPMVVVAEQEAGKLGCQSKVSYCSISCTFYLYWCSPRYETADISHHVVRQSCIDTQLKKIKLQSYFHVKVDKNVNPFTLFLSKKTMFSLFPFFQAAEVAVTLKFQIRVGASNRHNSARVCGHVFTCSI